MNAGAGSSAGASEFKRSPLRALQVGAGDKRDQQPTATSPHKFTGGDAANSTLIRRCKRFGGAKPRSRRNSSGRNYFVTISVGLLPSNSAKDEVRESSILLLPFLHAYVVALESYHVEPDHCHLHGYLQFESKMKLKPLNEILRCYYDGCSVNFQKCKKVESVIRYISKEDRNLMFKNVKYNFLSFQYRAYWWAMKCKKFEYSDPFVIEYFNYSRFLENLCICIQHKKRVSFQSE